MVVDPGYLVRSRTIQEKGLGMPVTDYLDQANPGGKTHPSSGQCHSMSWSPGLKEKQRVSCQIQAGVYSLAARVTIKVFEVQKHA